MDGIFYTIQSPLHNSQRLHDSPQLQQQLYYSRPLGTSSLHNSSHFQAIPNSPLLQPQLFYSEQLVPMYYPQNLQPANQMQSINQIVLYNSPAESGQMPNSPTFKAKRYPYYPEIRAEEPTFIPAPMNSILASHGANLPPINYRSAIPPQLHLQQPAPQLKSIRDKHLAADACCSVGVSLSTLGISVTLFIIFVVVAIELGFNDSFCNGYVSAPRNPCTNFFLSHPSLNQWKYDSDFQLSGQVSRPEFERSVHPSYSPVVAAVGRHALGTGDGPHLSRPRRPLLLREPRRRRKAAPDPRRPPRRHRAACALRAVLACPRQRLVRAPIPPRSRPVATVQRRGGRDWPRLLALTCARGHAGCLVCRGAKGRASSGWCRTRASRGPTAAPGST